MKYVPALVNTLNSFKAWVITTWSMTMVADTILLASALAILVSFR